MLQTLVNHNDDIRRLVEKGYAAGFDSNYLILRDIPYLDGQGELQSGAIVTQLVFVDQVRVQQQNHQVSFSGSAPYGLNGLPVANMGDTPHHIVLGAGCSEVAVQRQFSNKPANGYRDFFHKIEQYVALISGPAMERYSATPYTFAVYGDGPDDTVFKVRDTLTTRAEISDLASTFKDETVAIIGLGGTGGYVLDLMIKTPVRGIRAFDADDYHVHNSYRSPGRLSESELGLPKAEVYAARYENFRTGLTLSTKFVDESSSGDFEGVTFAFVCVDKGSSRAKIIDLLIALGIPFVDVGMGLNRKRGPITGSLRTTYFSAASGQHVRDQNLVPTHDTQDDIYKTNIQIAELNALNACLAVILYKKKMGFYVDDDPAHHVLFNLGDMHIIGQPDED